MDWKSIAFGGVSLFPLFGHLKDLRGFYFRNCRNWFIVFSTIFSLFIYYFLEWHFEQLEGFPFFISPWTTILIALVALLAYIGLLLNTKERFSVLTTQKRTLVIIAAFISYMTMIIALTFSFNFLAQTRDYYLIKGVVEVSGDKLRTSGQIEISFGLERDDSHIFRQSGRFFIIIKKGLYNNINSIFFRVDQGEKVYSWTCLKRDIPVNVIWRVTVFPEKGGV